MTNTFTQSINTLRALSLWTALLATTTCWAHHSPEETIAILSARIEADPSPIVLTQRAAERVILSRFSEARTDLEQAIALDERFWMAHLDLANVLHKMGNTEEGLRHIDTALEKFSSTRSRCSFRQLQAILYEANDEPVKALDAINRAIQQGSVELDDFLRRSKLQAVLKLNKERLLDLEHAMTLNPGIVLKNEYIDALIDAKHWEKALPLVEQRLDQSRRKSPWLIRRAKILGNRTYMKQASEDLKNAETEIEKLLNPERPHLGLMVELAQIYEMTDRPLEAERIRIILDKTTESF